MTDVTDVLLGPAIIIIADIVAFLLVSRLGTRSSGTGTKYQPFSGGEEFVPPRGLYRSDLFVFATLFLVVEAFALILSASFAAPTPYYPLLFLIGGGSVLTVTVWWYIYAGGGEI